MTKRSFCENNVHNDFNLPGFFRRSQKMGSVPLKREYRAKVVHDREMNIRMNETNLKTPQAIAALLISMQK